MNKKNNDSRKPNEFDIITNPQPKSSKFKYGSLKRDNLIKDIEASISEKKLEKKTLDDILALFEKKYHCNLCKIVINDDEETISCSKCFQIMHIKCVKKVSKQKKDQYCFTCQNCKKETTYYKNDLFYNCYCQRYNEEEKNPIFDPNFIPHGCGTICDEILCIHLNCSLYCHPGPHEKCNKIVNVLCPCGKVQKEYACGEEKKESPCGKECGKLMDCLKHNCTSSCHEGLCFCKQCLVKPKMKETTVVNLKGQIKAFGPSCEKDPDVVYCGRRVSGAGAWNLRQSIWGNPYKVKDFKDINDVISNFEKYARRTPRIMDNLQLLVGKKLACWCDPDPCHTKVLIKLMKEKKLI